MWRCIIIAYRRIPITYNTHTHTRTSKKKKRKLKERLNLENNGYKPGKWVTEILQHFYRRFEKNLLKKIWRGAVTWVKLNNIKSQLFHYKIGEKVISIWNILRTIHCYYI
jgi:hypothetical protein